MSRQTPHMLSTESRVEFLKRLSEADLNDVLIVQRESAERALTEKRTELVEEISTGEAASVRDLARRVGRDVSIVSRDLDVLFEEGIVDFERDGRAKKPVLARETVLVEPLVFEGEVAFEVDGEAEVSA